MNLRLLLSKLPQGLFIDLCEDFGIKKTSSKEAMIKDFILLIEKSDSKEVTRFFEKFKEYAYPYELKVIAATTGRKKYGLPEAIPENKDKLFEIITKNIGYDSPDKVAEKTAPSKITEKKSKISESTPLSRPKNAKVDAVAWAMPPDRIMNMFISMPYSFPQAVADVIDNSLDAGAKNVDIYQTLDEDTGERFLIIQDDGSGMNEKELHKSLGIGSDREYKEHELGKFGTGLKLSSLSQAKEVSVFSKKHKNDEISYRRISVEHVLETKKLELLKNMRTVGDALSRGHIEAKERLANQAGTIVLWEKMDRNPHRPNRKTYDFLNKNIMELREHLSMIFYRYVSGKNQFGREFSIRVHESSLDVLDPFMKHETQEYGVISKKAVVPVHFDDKEINVNVELVIIPHSTMVVDRVTYKRLSGIKSHNKSQGFYIFRNERLIMHDDWLGMWSIEDKYKCLKISIDIPRSLDNYFEIDPTKTSYSLPEEFSDDLKDVILSKSRNWKVNKKDMNFRERGKYRQNNESFNKTQRPTPPSKGLAESKKIDPMAPTSQYTEDTQKKKPKKPRSKKIEVLVQGSLNPDVVFTSHPPGVTQININKTHDLFEDAVDRLKKKLRDL